jgi:hypothetical protein
MQRYVIYCINSKPLHNNYAIKDGFATSFLCLLCEFNVNRIWESTQHSSYRWLDTSVHHFHGAIYIFMGYPHHNM